LGFFGCNASGKTGGSSVSADEILSKDASYALGMNIGSNLKSDGIYPDMEEFKKGILDILNDAETRFDMDMAYEVFFESYNEIRERKDAAVSQQEMEFLAENSRKPGIIITESGLQYEIITDADGPKPGMFDMVKAHYEGTLIDGTVFDSSFSRGEPSDFRLSEVIPGWTEGLMLMSVGSNYRFYIPSELGYGPHGAGGIIPPYSTLIFEIQLLEITPNEHEFEDFEHFF